MSRAERRKNKKKRKLGFFPLIIAVAAIFVLTSLVLLFTDSLGLTSSLRKMITSSSLETGEEDSLRLIEGDYTIDAPGETLENTHITGSLVLGPGIGDGSVELISVIVDDKVLVRGGGMDTVYVHNCDFNKVKVNRPGERVRLVVSGKTTVGRIYLQTGARLVENLDAGVKGFRKVEVTTAEKVELHGSYQSLDVLAEEANIEIESEMLDKLLVDSTAGGTAIKLLDDMIIKNLYLDGTTYLLGRVRVDRAFLSASGLTELYGDFNEVRITSEAGQYDLTGDSSFSKLIVAKDALNNGLNLEEDVLVSYLELNEAVEVKGEGKIEKVLVNASGSTMEQIPGDIEFADGVTIFIAGHEISSPGMLDTLREHGDPHYSPAEPSGQEMQETAAEPEPSPEPAPEPEPEPGPEPDPEPESTEEDSGGLPGFSLEVAEPDAEDESLGLLVPQGKVLVFVTLDAADPGNYRVKLGGKELRFLADVKTFYGVVEKEDPDTLRGKVTIEK